MFSNLTTCPLAPRDCFLCSGTLLFLGDVQWYLQTTVQLVCHSGKPLYASWSFPIADNSISDHIIHCGIATASPAGISIWDPFSLLCDRHLLPSLCLSRPLNVVLIHLTEQVHAGRSSGSPMVPKDTYLYRSCCVSSCTKCVNSHHCLFAPSPLILREVWRLSENFCELQGPDNFRFTLSSRSLHLQPHWDHLNPTFHCDSFSSAPANPDPGLFFIFPRINHIKY